MKHLTLILFALALSAAGCSSLSMKRCDAPFAQADVMHCPEGIQGPYRGCQKPIDMYQGCVTPQ